MKRFGTLDRNDDFFPRPEPAGPGITDSAETPANFTFSNYLSPPSTGPKIAYPMTRSLDRL